MPAGHGLRSRTRDTFSRGFRQKGYINLTTYLRAFKLGDNVDIKVNGAVHKVGRHGVCFRDCCTSRSHLQATVNRSAAAGWGCSRGPRAGAAEANVEGCLDSGSHTQRQLPAATDVCQIEEAVAHAAAAARRQHASSAARR